MPEHSKLGQQLIDNARLALAHVRGEYEPPKSKRAPIPTTAQETAVATPPTYDGARIRAIRERLALSQRVFAEALNVSPATVRAWAQGQRIPEGPTRRLLEIAEEHPEVFAEKVRPPDARTAPIRHAAMK